MIEYLTNPPQLNLHHSLPFIYSRKQALKQITLKQQN